ncbi:hypothetical protein JCM9279_002373, partial [Rhodotorula babjevae]
TEQQLEGPQLEGPIDADLDKQLEGPIDVDLDKKLADKLGSGGLGSAGEHEMELGRNAVARSSSPRQDEIDGASGDEALADRSDVAEEKSAGAVGEEFDYFLMDEFGGGSSVDAQADRQLVAYSSDSDEAEEDDEEEDVNDEPRHPKRRAAPATPTSASPAKRRRRAPDSSVAAASEPERRSRPKAKPKKSLGDQAFRLKGARYHNPSPQKRAKLHMPAAKRRRNAESTLKLRAARAAKKAGGRVG